MLDTLIKNKIKELPKNIQYAIEHFPWADEVNIIAKKYQFQIDDLGILRRETLLVMVGLVPAEDFKKNLRQHLSLDEETTEKLVSDLNEYIFLPLRKLAFSHHEEIEPELIPHEKINDIMSDLGVELVNERETRERPNTELQKLADSLFHEKTEEELPEEKKKEELPLKEERKPQYREPIEEEDMRGIYEHRIDTSMLPTQTKQSDPLREHLSENMHISHTEHIDVSPSKGEQIKENGEFLKHIGAV